MRVVETLAAHILDDTFFEVPEQVREKALCCVLDAVTSAVVGHRATSTIACRITSERLFGKGTASVWLSGQTRNAVGAAFCNSAAVSALDFDDGHRAARGHPGAAVIPAALTAIIDPAR